MSRNSTESLPLAAIAVRDLDERLPDLPIAYVPRIPDGRTYRDVMERAVAWGRR